MRKDEFITQVAARSGLTKKAAEQAADAVFETIAQALAQGEKLNIVGFGAFETRERPARTCRNIHTGAPIAVQAALAPVFKPAKQLKERVNRVCD